MPFKDPQKRKDYNREYQRLWARENRDKRLVYERAWNEAHREERRAIGKRARYKDPEKYRAQNTLARGVRAGKVVRGTCEVCGTPDDVQGHHDDYTKPLDVRWLCRQHHMELHRARTDHGA